ncbi:MAG: tetratricopeptide repeat protein [Planctomycetota bacterium]|jgi:tetratricopeptide (TPR) repeat protein
MLLRLNNCLLGILICALTANVAFSAGPGQPALRKMKLGDTMLEFSLPDSTGKLFEYKHNRKRVLAMVFLSADQKQSKSAASDIQQILADLRAKAAPFDFVGVMTEPPKSDFFESADPKSAFPVLLDSQYKLWGKLGIIARPTVLIIGKDDKASWIRAGHAYDFAPALRSNLSHALGIAGAGAPEETVEARALANSTAGSRVKRHLQMAKMLEKKGRFDAAIAEVRKAQALDPRSVEPILELAELLCRTGKGKAALETIEKVQAAERRDNARLMLISGWAGRLTGDLASAEKHLLGATKLDPRSTRGYFELGKLFRARGEKDKAIAAYHRALTLVFGEN